MKIEIICIGKNKDRYIDEAVSDFLVKLKKHAEVELIYLKESPATHGDIEKIKKEEGERIVEKLKPGYQKIALDVLGKQVDSIEFARLMERNRDNFGAKIQFIIGGPHGLSGQVLMECEAKISFSKMTFTHQLIRLLLLEQIYRGFEIIRGSEYHK